MIDGVVITPLKQFVDERGKVMHMLRADAPFFKGFGEIYFSEVNPGAIKAWHWHSKMTINYAVPVGHIKFVLYDEREGSPTRGEIQEIFLGPDAYNLVTVPPGIWNGFKGYGSGPALVADCANHAFEPGEAKRRAFDDPAIPYNWAIRNG